MPSSIKRTALFFVAFTGIFVAICGPRLNESYQKRGAGGTDVSSASGVRLTAIFGLRPNSHLGFLILVRFPTPGASIFASSTWVGSAKHKSGVQVAFRASLSSIEINGAEFDFAAGRVFFAQAKSGTVEIHQLELELQDADYSDEIDRLAKTQAIEKLLQ